jgi:hypothetical protein
MPASSASAVPVASSASQTGITAPAQSAGASVTPSMPFVDALALILGSAATGAQGTSDPSKAETGAALVKLQHETKVSRKDGGTTLDLLGNAVPGITLPGTVVRNADIPGADVHAASPNGGDAAYAPNELPSLDGRVLAGSERVVDGLAKANTNTPRGQRPKLSDAGPETLPSGEAAVAAQTVISAVAAQSPLFAAPAKPLGGADPPAQANAVTTRPPVGPEPRNDARATDGASRQDRHASATDAGLAVQAPGHAGPSLSGRAPEQNSKQLPSPADAPSGKVFTGLAQTGPLQADPTPTASQVVTSSSILLSSPMSPSALEPTTAAAHGTATAQVVPALVALAQAPDGASRLTLRLHPSELGQVDIRIERPIEGPARIAITVERPETLTLLQHDEPQLLRALGQAGVQTDGRSLSMHIASGNQSVVAASGSSGDGSGFSDSGSSAGFSSDHQGPDPKWSGASDNRNGGGGFFGPNDGAFGNELSDVDPHTPEPRWLRAGLDITA